MDCKHVFIVDDDVDIRDSFMEALTIEGFSVGSAIHGQDALDQLHAMTTEQLPGCIFLDLKMPIMDGMAFLETVKGDLESSIALIPIVVVSANGSLHNIDLKPAIETLAKPFDLNEIYRLAHHFCGYPVGGFLH
ncbi:MAG TPA: response regulator [Bacteriovoracaceae bacterium]|nr:response regulator [Bacteriovoracaceae bacterium]